NGAHPSPATGAEGAGKGRAPGIPPLSPMATQVAEASDPVTGKAKPATPFSIPAGPSPTLLPLEGAAPTKPAAGSAAVVQTPASPGPNTMEMPKPTETGTAP